MLSKIAATLAVTFGIGWATATATANEVASAVDSDIQQAHRVCSAMGYRNPASSKYVKCISDELLDN